MISQRIKSARKAKKLTQEQLATKVQTTKGTISNYENGHSSPSNEMIILLADVLDCTADYLLGRTDTPEPTPLDPDEAAFQAFANNPELNTFYKELPESDEEAVERLREIWEIIKKDFKK